MICPKCGSDNIDVPMVDNGVGMQQCSPAGCLNCGWVQSEDDYSLLFRTGRTGCPPRRALARSEARTQREREQMLTLAEYRQLALEASPRCPDCGESFGGQILDYYPHSRGWKVTGFVERLWLYLTCRRCGYQWSLWKLGVEINSDVIRENA
ncbi:MAG: hypothetical protein ACREIS_02930 [Nitrospiraceae bacterium]